MIRSWLEHGNAWDPRSGTSPHSTTIETEPRRHECYYSQFQIFELEHLLQALTATVEIFDPATKRKPHHHPIVRFLETVAERAGRNHQPLTQAMWEHNQRTGYSGTLRPGPIGRRKKLFGTPGRKRRKPR